MTTACKYQFKFRYETLIIVSKETMHEEEGLKAEEELERKEVVM